MYIVIEGIDTAGKSTQIDLVAKNFNDSIITKEPGGTKLGVKIREIVLFDDVKSSMSELLLFLADRAEHIEEVIKPNIEKMIFSDRSLISGIAYALIAKKFTLEKLVELNKFATQEILPDIVFILKLSQEELTDRLSQKEHDKIESRGVEYLLSIQDALIKATTALGIKHYIIDATKSIDNITEEITTTIKENNVK